MANSKKPMTELGFNSKDKEAVFLRMAKSRSRMPGFDFDNLKDVTLSQEQTNQLRLQDSEIQCTQLKKELATSQAQNLCLKKEVQKVIESNTKSNAALTCISNAIDKFLEEDDCPPLINMMYSKEMSVEELREYSQSLEILIEMYEESKKLPVEENEYWLYIANSIGDTYSELKDYDEAKRWFEKAVEISERIKGKENKQTINSKRDVATVLRKQGKFKEALTMYQKVQDVEISLMHMQRLDHAEMLDTAYYIAICRFHQKEYEDALRMFKELLEVTEEVLGADHSKAMNSKEWIARTYKSLGRIEESYPIFKEVYESRVKTLGLKHPDTIYGIFTAYKMSLEV